MAEDSLMEDTLSSLPAPELDESSQDTMDSLSQDSQDSKMTRKTPQVRGVAVFLSQAQGLGAEIAADKLISYDWPPDGSGEKWFLQEQITEFLGIKSFKRKYPHIARRTIGDPHERDFLRDSGAVSESQMELGLTAVRSGDILSLMRNDYPEQMAAYQLVLKERAKKEMEIRQAEMLMETLEIKNDAQKLGELRAATLANAAAWNKEANASRKAERRGYWDIQTNVSEGSVPKLGELRAATLANAAAWNKEANASRKAERRGYWDIQTNVSEGSVPKLGELREATLTNAAAWNKEANASRKAERRGYWDIQTNQIQYPQKKAKKEIIMNARPPFGDYPTPLIHGQFGNYYKKLEPEELARLPLRTALDCGEYLPVRKPPSPPPITISEQEIEHLEAAQARAERIAQNPDIATPTSRGKATGKDCAFCREDLRVGDRFIECAECGSSGHPSCMDMSEAMLRVVTGYQWMCMECKPCSLCSKLDQEDKMLFCDLCDRGYHTFCVGLDALPQGVWVCEMYCKGQELPKDGLPTGGRRSADGRGDTEFIKCRDCGTGLSKDNKVHHRSKYRHAGLCSKCVLTRS